MKSTMSVVPIRSFRQSAGRFFTLELDGLALQSQITAFGGFRLEDHSIRHRLGLREVGSALELHLQRSRDRALELDLRSPEWVHRIVSTDAKPTGTEDSGYGDR
jgi:hypothetical protein